MSWNCHHWLWFPLWQAHSWTAVPLAVLPAESSTHRPLCVLTMLYQAVVEIPPVLVGTGVFVAGTGVLVGGCTVGVAVGALPLTLSQLIFMPPLSTTRRSVCAPALRLTPLLVIVVKVCQ